MEMDNSYAGADLSEIPPLSEDKDAICTNGTRFLYFLQKCKTQIT